MICFIKTLAEECSSAIERSSAITGVRQALALEMDLVINVFKHVLSNETDPAVLSECMAASAEWMDSVVIESVLPTHSDLVDLLYRLAPTSPAIYASVCDALTEIFNCGHCGLEANKRTQSMLLHQLSLLAGLQSSFYAALELHCAKVEVVEDEDLRGQCGAMERIVEELVTHPDHAEASGTLSFFEMLMKFFTTSGCYLLHEECSAQLMEAWFSYQSALLDLTSVSPEATTITTACSGVKLAYQIYDRFLQALFDKISYPNEKNWQELIENELWHAYRQDVLDAFLASLNHPERRGWLLESFNFLVSLSDRWKFTPSTWNLHPFVHTCYRLARRLPDPGDLAGVSEIESRLLAYTLFCLRIDGPKGYADNPSAVSTLPPDILLWLFLISSALNAVSEFLQNTTHLTRNDAETLLSTLTDAGVRLTAVSKWRQPMCSLLRRRMFYCVGRLFTFVSEATSVTQFAQIYLLPLVTEAEGTTLDKTGLAAQLEELAQAKKYFQPTVEKSSWATMWSEEINNRAFGCSSSQLFKLLTTLCAFGEFFRGVGEVAASTSLGSSFYTETCLRSTRQPHARALVRSLALRIFKLLEHLAACNQTILTEMSEMITWLCDVALSAAICQTDKQDFPPVEPEADGKVKGEASSNLELIVALHDFVCTSGLSREENIADCLPLCWLLFERMVSAGVCPCSHQSQAITFAGQAVNAIICRISNYLLTRGVEQSQQFYLLAPLRLASMMHELTGDLQRFAVFLAKLISWKLPACTFHPRLVDETPFLSAASPEDTKLAVVALAFTCLCLPEAEPFKAGSQLTTSLLPDLRKREDPILFTNLNASLLAFLLRVPSQSRRQYQVASLFAKLASHCVKQQTAALRVVLGLTPLPPVGVDREIINEIAAVTNTKLTNVDRADLVSTLTKVGTPCRLLSRALDRFLCRC
ncbi:unnamed protein product [Dibothriocephalus latus]|uniref:Uncharacterized protein n=1 Tax=Dibothriocephalus latus TaxID=60516 RepID=A0A3P6TEC8_DIBLA|nr:unnamed protein product [Dibothriocephalus latus]